MNILVGDLGGTKVDLAFIKEGRLIKKKRFFSSQFKDFNEILSLFIDQKIDKGVLGVAGFVEKGRRCQMTHLSWSIEADLLEKIYSIPHVEILNDLEALGWGLHELPKGAILTLNKGKQQAGNRVVVSAGTGLGVAALYWDGKRHHPFATEGGHVDFAPKSNLEEEFYHYLLQKEKTRISFDQVLSKSGIEEFYQFLLTQSPHLQKVPEKMNIFHIVKETTPLCKEALLQFASFYGAFSGNVALQFLSQGGVYLGGGIVPKIVKWLKGETFLQAFLAKGTFQKLLATFPIHLILHDHLPLIGAWKYSQRKHLFV